MPADIKHISQRLRGERDDQLNLVAEALDNLQAYIDSVKKTVISTTSTATATVAAEGDYQLTIVGTAVDINLDNGVNQNLDLNVVTVITINAPTRSSKPLAAGDKLWITIKSVNPVAADSRAVAWNIIFKGVDNVPVNPADGARTIYYFTYRTVDSTWVLKNAFSVIY